MNRNYKEKKTIDAIESTHGRVVPYAIPSEKYVLGTLLMEMLDAGRVCHLLTPEMFYREEHRLIYSAILSLFNGSDPVSTITVSEELRRTGEIENVGGPYYLAQLTMDIGSGAHFDYHADLMFEKYIRRELINTCTEVISDVFDETTDVEEIIAATEQKMNGIIQQVAGNVEPMHIQTIANECVEDMFRRMKDFRDGRFPGITTGLSALDEITLGWRPSNLIILAARPSMGKTAMMLHFAKSAAKSGKTALLFSLEMSANTLGDRLLLSEGELRPYRYKSGDVTHPESQQVEESLLRIGALPLYIDDGADKTMSRIRARAKAMRKNGKCDIVFIDYLQLCRERNMGNRNRNDEVSAMSREAKIMAKELNVPVILLSQLSRKVEERTNKRPLLSDLRDSGSIEQDADLVIFIYRESYYSEKEDDHKGQLFISKNREGACGNVNFLYNVGMTQILDDNENRF